MSVSEACESILEGLEAGRIDIIKSIIDHVTNNKGTDFLLEVLSNDCCQEGTILHKAVRIGSSDAVRALLMAGSDPGILNSNGVSVLDSIDDTSFPSLLQVFTEDLFRNIAGSATDRIIILLNSGISLDVVDSDKTKNSCLHWAASFGSPDTISLLLARGAQVNALNSEGATPLHDAVLRADPRVVQLLLDSGSDVNSVILSGKYAEKSALDLAEGKEEISTMLRDQSLKKETNVTEEPGGNVEKLDEDKNIDTKKEKAGLEEISTITSQELKSKSLKLALDRRFGLLWPTPQVVEQLAGADVEIPKHLYLVVESQSNNRISAHQLLDVWDLFREDLEGLGYSASVKRFDLSGQSSAGPGEIQLAVNSSLGEQDFTLVLTEKKIKMIGGGVTGVQYAVSTFLQILQLFRNVGIPPVSIKDRPMLTHRAALLDLAPYGRLPTVSTLLNLVRILSNMKLNKIYLYSRLSSTPDWQLNYSPGDLISIDRECSDRQMELIPALDIVQPCAFIELPKYTQVFSRVVSCFSSLNLVSLGPCLSSVIFSAARIIGCNQVFGQIWNILSVPSNTQLILCSNSVLNLENMVEDFPSSVSLIDYGFQANYPFESNLHHLSRSGNPVLCCPGTSAWNCLIGRPQNMIHNIAQAAKAIAEYGGEGLVIANWTGSPALTHLSTALPGWVLGAGLAWNTKAADTINLGVLGEILSHHIFQDSTGGSGSAVVELGLAECSLDQVYPDQQLQTSLLLSSILRPGNLHLEKVSLEQLGAVIQTSRRCLSKLQGCREVVEGEGEVEGLLQEVTLGAELLLLAARLSRGLLQAGEYKIELLQPTFKTDIANKLLALIEQYRAVWLIRYLPID
ncbi:uncharacterized protein LOC111706387 isoform X2 [Eurytemora carolleeae]|uniref:uncharacterized protein LOC111706387 isoform X2 n=1 Tax=Eurytemora carolleeae TaxID=1294199 RepID=UPI000C76475A|nr:uncharacterized protein LOC111706387 isoform X2 [Eurytemora carolleeae]|eukprot:XP_023335018.1 uncharacterized protein LOC111706387 isoform X2 [Eurytemora affinis]